MTANSSQKNLSASHATGRETSADTPEELASLEIAFAAARTAYDKKAEKIKILDLRKQSTVADYFVICSAMSDRQVQAICESILSTLKASGHKAIASEGLSEGRWVLLDFGDVIVHVFIDAIRDYYDIEGLWKTAGKVPLPSELFSPAASQTTLPPGSKLN